MVNTTHEKHLGHLCARVARAFHARMERRTQEVGLPFSQAIVLLYLYHHGASTLAEMARDMSFAHPSVLRQVDMLEKVGYVKRKPHREDRRMKVIHLTTKGRAQVASVIKIADEIQKQATVGFTPKEIEQLRANLLKLNINLREMEIA